MAIGKNIVDALLGGAKDPARNTDGPAQARPLLHSQVLALELAQEHLEDLRAPDEREAVAGGDRQPPG